MEGRFVKSYFGSFGYIPSLSKLVRPFGKCDATKAPQAYLGPCPYLAKVWGGVRSGPTPFRFENVWLKADSFQDLLKIWWQGMSVQGSLSFILTKKLKKIKW